MQVPVLTVTVMDHDGISVSCRCGIVQRLPSPRIVEVIVVCKVQVPPSPVKGLAAGPDWVRGRWQPTLGSTGQERCSWARRSSAPREAVQKRIALSKICDGANTLATRVAVVCAQHLGQDQFWHCVTLLWRSSLFLVVCVRAKRALVCELWTLLVCANNITLLGRHSLLTLSFSPASSRLKPGHPPRAHSCVALTAWKRTFA